MSETTIFKVANAFLRREPMTHKKLQKMCYYAYCWYLTLYPGKRLFDNNFEAWVHGPVDPKLYNKYKEYGWKEIEDFDDEDTLGEESESFIDNVMASYGHLDGDQLEYLTHRELPWKNARGDLPPYEASRNPIMDDDIRGYYSRMIEDGQIE